MSKKSKPAFREARTSKGDRRSNGLGNENIIASREKSLEAREFLNQNREQTSEYRDSSALIREEAVSQRELIASHREKNNRETEAVKKSLEGYVVQLRQANEHLVISNIQSQSMTEEVQRAKDALGYMAHHDFLTDLPNRILLMDRLNLDIASAKRRNNRLAVLFLDLDRFKIINDSLGHAIGDYVLKAVAGRLLKTIRVTDIASRLGGDEFVVVLSDVDGEYAVGDIADAICKAIVAPYDLDGHTGYIGATIGISLYPEDGDDALTLISNADVAMYYAKKNGRGSYHFFHSEMNARAVERQRTEADLHFALEHGEFLLYYQPKVNLCTGEISGFEALLRWQHPKLGMMEPAKFISLAEDCGLIVPIGRWVLNEACAQVKRWSLNGIFKGSIAVNISALEFNSSNFVEHVRKSLLDNEMNPSLLELEITESVLMNDATSNNEILVQLKSVGVSLALDDFGTGYSSLSYLKHFPIDVLKIDQSFVRDIGEPNGNSIIVDAVIAMGNSLGKRIVAEGIEGEDQLRFLRERNCSEGQGYFFSRPLTANDCTKLLESSCQINGFAN